MIWQAPPASFQLSAHLLHPWTSLLACACAAQALLAGDLRISGNKVVLRKSEWDNPQEVFSMYVIGSSETGSVLLNDPASLRPDPRVLSAILRFMVPYPLAKVALSSSTKFSVLPMLDSKCFLPKAGDICIASRTYSVLHDDVGFPTLEALDLLHCVTRADVGWQRADEAPNTCFQAVTVCALLAFSPFADGQRCFCPWCRLSLRQLLAARCSGT